MTPPKKTAKGLVKGIQEVASPPETYSRINEIIKHPECSVGNIAEIIAQDPGLTSKLLKLANSAFFGFAKQVETVTRAVTLLGTEQVRDLALATSVIELFKDIPEDLVNMRSFWTHSIGCGILAKLMAVHNHHRDVEKLFIIGILHDLGRIILLSKKPEEMKKALDLAEKKECSLVQAEREIFGFCHAEVGEALMLQWHLPQTLIEPVRYHHQPGNAVQYYSETQIVHIADLLVHAMELGSSGENKVPILSQTTWKKSGLKTDALSPLMDQTEQEVELIAGALLS